MKEVVLEMSKDSGRSELFGGGERSGISWLEIRKGVKG